MNSGEYRYFTLEASPSDADFSISLSPINPKLAAALTGTKAPEVDLFVSTDPSPDETQYQWHSATVGADSLLIRQSGAGAEHFCSGSQPN